MADDSIPRCILLIALIISAGLLNGSKTAVSFCDSVHIKTLADKGNSKASSLIKLLDKYDKTLITLFICVTLIYVSASSVMTMLLMTWLKNAAALIGLIPFVFIIYIFCELIPKKIVKSNCNDFLLTVVPILNFIILIFTPISSLIIVKSKVIKNVEKEGIIELEKSGLIRSAIDFCDITAAEVMTPRESIISLEQNSSDETVKQVLLDSKLSRIPVYTSNLDCITGTLNAGLCLQKLYNGQKLDLKYNDITPSYCIHTDIDLETLFQEMCRRRSHLAIVKDNNGRTVGLVTMDDILEEISGVINDKVTSEDIITAPLNRGAEV